MKFDLTDTQFQTFLIRLLSSAFLLITALLLFAISYAIDNQRLTRIVWKAAEFVGSFFFLRIVAGVLDSYYAFEVGWFSSIINSIFWCWIIEKLYHIWRILRAPKNDEVRIHLSGSFDILLNQLQTAKANLKRIKKELL